MVFYDQGTSYGVRASSPCCISTGLMRDRFRVLKYEISV